MIVVAGVAVGIGLLAVGSIALCWCFGFGRSPGYSSPLFANTSTDYYDTAPLVVTQRPYYAPRQSYGGLFGFLGGWGQPGGHHHRHHGQVARHHGGGQTAHPHRGNGFPSGGQVASQHQAGRHGGGFFPSVQVASHGGHGRQHGHNGGPPRMGHQ